MSDITTYLFKSFIRRRITIRKRSRLSPSSSKKIRINVQNILQIQKVSYKVKSDGILMNQLMTDITPHDEILVRGGYSQGIYRYRISVIRLDQVVFSKSLISPAAWDIYGCLNMIVNTGMFDAFSLNSYTRGFVLRIRESGLYWFVDDIVDYNEDNDSIGVDLDLSDHDRKVQLEAFLSCIYSKRELGYYSVRNVTKKIKDLFDFHQSVTVRQVISDIQLIGKIKDISRELRAIKSIYLSKIYWSWINIIQHGFEGFGELEGEVKTYRDIFKRLESLMDDEGSTVSDYLSFIEDPSFNLLTSFSQSQESIGLLCSPEVITNLIETTKIKYKEEIDLFKQTSAYNVEFHDDSGAWWRKSQIGRNVYKRLVKGIWKEVPEVSTTIDMEGNQCIKLGRLILDYNRFQFGNNFIMFSGNAYNNTCWIDWGVNKGNDPFFNKSIKIEGIMALTTIEYQDRLGKIYYGMRKIDNQGHHFPKVEEFQVNEVVISRKDKFSPDSELQINKIYSVSKQISNPNEFVHFYQRTSLNRYLDVITCKEKLDSSYYFEKAIEVTLVSIELESEKPAFSVDLKEILSLNENKDTGYLGSTVGSFRRYRRNFVIEVIDCYSGSTEEWKITRRHFFWLEKTSQYLKLKSDMKCREFSFKTDFIDHTNYLETRRNQPILLLISSNLSDYKFYTVQNDKFISYSSSYNVLKLDQFHRSIINASRWTSYHIDYKKKTLKILLNSPEYEDNKPQVYVVEMKLKL